MAGYEVNEDDADDDEQMSGDYTDEQAESGDDADEMEAANDDSPRMDGDEDASSESAANNGYPLGNVDLNGYLAAVKSWVSQAAGGLARRLPSLGR
jgi:hypothetical protein